MARICNVCGKRPQVGNLVSHANNRVKRWVYPNTQKINFRVGSSRSIQRGAVCTKCVKSGKVEKVV
jgi:large subunit ribosomal protein L28